MKESVFLFLLIGSLDTLEEKYVGRPNSCEDTINLMQKLEKKYKNINGYLCVDSRLARKKFMHKPTPQEEFIIKEIKELTLPPKPVGKPLILKKKYETN